MLCKQMRPRLLPCVLLALAGTAGWCNARYWAAHYLQMGLTLSLADYACFSQQASLTPSLIMPLMLFGSGVRHTGIYTKRHMYRYASRWVWWRKRCADAVRQAAEGGAVVLTSSVLPGFFRKKPWAEISWKSANSLFALMTGSPLQREVPLAVIILAYGAAVCLQLLACLLLYHMLACRLRPFAAFIAMALPCMAGGSPVCHTVWDAASLRYGCWAGPSGVAGVLAFWLALSAALCGAGYFVCRRADVL